MSAESAEIERDVRLGGTWTPSQRLKNAVIRGAVLALLVVLDRLPPSVVLALTRALGRLAGRVCANAARLATGRIAMALPLADAPAIAQACFEAAGGSLGICLLLRRPTVRALDWVAVPRRTIAALEGALSGGAGVVFVSAHIGPFELIPAAVCELGFPVTVVVRESYDPGLDRHVDGHRKLRGIEVVHRGHRGAPLAILRALRRGRPVGLLPDLGGRVRSAEVPFLGTRALLPTGPADLSARTGAPMVVGYLAPNPAKGPPFVLEIRALPKGDSCGLHEPMATAIAEAVRAHPELWLWMGAKSLRIAHHS